MIEVRIENPTGNKFEVRFPGAIVSIPPYAFNDNAFFVELPELPEVEKWLNDLSTRYRAISWSLVEETAKNEETIEDREPEPEPEPETEVAEEQEQESDSATDEMFEEFKASVVSVSKGGGGWWAVEIKGSDDPIKVRSCDHEDEAISLAYKEYLEG
jgi:hypothetical protein